MFLFLIPFLMVLYAQYCQKLELGRYLRGVSPSFDRFAIEKLGRPPLSFEKKFTVSKTAIIDTLIQEIAIKPGEPFRGSAVVYYYGTDDSPMAKKIGNRPGTPFDVRILSESDNRLNYYEFGSGSFGGEHAHRHLWYFDIPSIEQTSLIVTTQAYIFFSRIFYNEEDYPWHNMLVVRKLNTRILKGLGVRFVITDRELLGREFIFRQEIIGRSGFKLRLYEILGSNIINYSPTNIYVSKKAAETVSIIKKETFLFDKDVVLENSIDDVTLVPASESQMIYESTGIHIKASSDGVSLLLLPLEFSNCLTTKNIIPNKNVMEPKIVRANFVQTAVLFEGALDIMINYQFSFLNHECRQKDIDAMERFELREIEVKRVMPAWLYPYSLKKLFQKYNLGG